MYRANIIRKHYNSASSFMIDFWSELEAMGWTLEDNQDANSYRVYSSRGENDDKLIGYIKISYSTSALTFRSYIHWDSTNHSGTGTSYADHSININNSDFYAWIYGNKNLVLLTTLRGSTYQTFMFGHIPNIYWDTPKTNITADATSGDNVSIQVNSSDGFTVGNQYKIVDPDTGYRQTVTISNIPDNTHLVISHLSYDVKASAKIAITPIAFIEMYGTNTVSFDSLSSWGYNGNGSTTSYSVHLYSPLNTGYCDPDRRTNKYMLFPYIAYDMGYSNYENILGFGDEYIMFKSSGSNEDLMYINEQDSGTVSSADATHITDNTKSWTASSLAGKFVIITSGEGKGQLRKIQDNTDTQLTLTKALDIVPNNTSNYIIVGGAYRCFNSYAVKEGI